MLLYCQQFCKIFPVSSPSVWQRTWAAWRPLSPTSRARIRLSLYATCHTLARLSAPHPHVTHTYPPIQRSVVRPWWLSRSVSLFNHDTGIRHHQPHVRARTIACLGALDHSVTFSRIFSEHRDIVSLLWRTCESLPLVLWGDAPSYFGETPPRTLGRRPLVLWGDAPRTLGRRPSYFGETPLVLWGDRITFNLLFLKGLASLDFQEDFKKTTHTTVCV